MRSYGVMIVGVLAAVCATALSAAAGPDRIQSIDVEGTRFVVHLSNGQVLSGKDLAGATLTLQQPGAAEGLKVRVTDIQDDPRDPDHEVLLYHMLQVDSVTGEAQELCQPDAQGERWAFPVRGQWDPHGKHLSSTGYTLTCGDGAQGKCVRFGYKPWKVLPNGTRLEEYHQACVRLVTADYCGGHGTTRDGMLIDIYDKIGINDPDPDPQSAGVRFEAAWNPAGALCVAHTRVPENETLEQLAKDCPRLQGKLGDQACPEAGPWHSRTPAILFNRSK